MLNDFLAQQPIDVIVQTEITPTKVHLPTAIDPQTFYKDFQSAIETSELTTEKALYHAASHTPLPYESARDLLNKRLTFTR